MADELAELRQEAVERGIAFDGRWGVDRLREALANTDVEHGEAPAPANPKPRPPKPKAVRAGGHINRHDGAGWVLDK